MSSCAGDFHASVAARDPPAAGAAADAAGDAMRTGITSEASLSTRLHQWWATVPLVTSGVVVACVAVFVAALLVGYDSFQEVCSSPDFVIAWLQVYRAWTAVVFHKGILHLGLNMMALVPIASPLERLMGSARMAHAALLFPLTNSLIAALLAYAARLLTGSLYLVHECAIGYSGVIFSFIVLENSLNSGPTRSIWGVVNVPTAWYPWVLLALFQLIMPSASFLGHMSGILSGLAYRMGYLSFVTPAPSSFTALERLSFLAPVVRRPGYIMGGSSLATGGGPHFSLPTLQSLVSPAAGGHNLSQTLSNALASAKRSIQAAFVQLQERLRQLQAQAQPQYQSLPQSLPQARSAGGGHQTGAAVPAGYPMPGNLQPSTSGAGNIGPQSFGVPLFASPGAPPAGGSDPSADSKFPGKGRTLADATPSPIPISIHAGAPDAHRTVGGGASAAAAAAAAAAVARASGRAAPDARQPGQYRPENLRQPVFAPAQAGFPPVPGAPQGDQEESPGLQQLLAMGFPKDSASTALDAAGGDVATAVDLLSTT